MNRFTYYAPTEIVFGPGTELLGHAPTDEEIEAIATECTYGRTRTIGSFRTLSYDDIVAIYKACR